VQKAPPSLEELAQKPSVDQCGRQLHHRSVTIGAICQYADGHLHEASNCDVGQLTSLSRPVAS
jgi:hypothetical protein